MSSYLNRLTNRWLLHLVLDALPVLAATAVAFWSRHPAATSVGVGAAMLLLLRALHRATDRTRALLAGAYTDPLTGLPTRAVADHLLGEVDAAGTAVTVALADVDRLKAVNTVHGLAVGDRFLAAVAHCLRDAVGVHGTVARRGGDEFLIVTTLTPAAFVTAMDTVMASAAAGERDLRPTVSVGVAVTDGAATSYGLLCADAALHTAKRTGGQRTMIYDPHRDGEPRRDGTRPPAGPRDGRSPRRSRDGVWVFLTLPQAHAVHDALRLAAGRPFTADDTEPTGVAGTGDVASVESGRDGRAPVHAEPEDACHRLAAYVSAIIDRAGVRA